MWRATVLSRVLCHVGSPLLFSEVPFCPGRGLPSSASLQPNVHCLCCTRRADYGRRAVTTRQGRGGGGLGRSVTVVY